MNKEINSIKKAILVVSFGTTYNNARKATIDVIEEKIRNTFTDYEVRRAFTAHRIISKLKERDGITIHTPEEALAILHEEGFNEVIVQPLHLIPGEEFDYIKSVVAFFKKQGAFDKLAIGRPALYFKGNDESIPDDYEILAKALKEQIKSGETVLLMGHGTAHPANSAYSCLQLVLNDCELSNVHVATIDGYPTFKGAIEKLEREGAAEVTLMPLLLVAGDHALNDMAGDEEDSWKNILLQRGFKVNTYVHGLGENECFQDIYVTHIQDIISNKFVGKGKTKKGMK